MSSPLAAAKATFLAADGPEPGIRSVGRAFWVLDIVSQAARRHRHGAGPRDQFYVEDDIFSKTQIFAITGAGQFPVEHGKVGNAAVYHVKGANLPWKTALVMRCAIHRAIRHYGTGVVAGQS